MAAKTSSLMELSARDGKSADRFRVEHVLAGIMIRIGSEGMLEATEDIWNTYVDVDYPFLRIPFIYSRIYSRLRDGETSDIPLPPFEFFEGMMVLGVGANWLTLPGNPDPEDEAMDNLWSHLMWWLGGKKHETNFVIAIKEINMVKGAMARGANHIAPENMEKKARDEIKAARGSLRGVVGMFNYMNTRDGPDFRGQASNIIRDVVEQLTFAEGLWNQNNPTNTVRLTDFWHEWLHHFYLSMTEHSQEYAKRLIGARRSVCDSQEDDEARNILEEVDSLEEDLVGLKIKTDHFYTPPLHR
ncbi:hypothetical protein FALCPG4_008695 [Fusarium falciforme]